MNIEGDNNKLKIHNLRGTEKIFFLTSHEDKIIQRNATMVFGILSSLKEIQNWCRYQNNIIIKMLTFLSQNYDQLTNEYAALFVKNIGMDIVLHLNYQLKKETLSNLIGMLSLNDADAIYNSLCGINNICNDFEIMNIICELDGINSILKLIKSEFPQIQEMVLKIFIKLSLNGNF